MGVGVTQSLKGCGFAVCVCEWHNRVCALSRDGGEVGGAVGQCGGALQPEGGTGTGRNEGMNVCCVRSTARPDVACNHTKHSYVK